MNILVTPPVNETHRALLESAWPGAEFTYIRSKELTYGDVLAADVIVGNVPPAFLAGADRLRFLQLGSAGTEGFPEAMPEGTKLANSSGAYGLAISEYMLAQLFAILKKHYTYYDNQRESLWRDEGP